VPLVENALEPGKKRMLWLWAKPTHPGSAFFSLDGLALVVVSSSGDWNRFVVDGGNDALKLYQGDGIVVEEFTIRGHDRIAAFDAGSFLLAPVTQ
jgi:hypothetical protein